MKKLNLLTLMMLILFSISCSKEEDTITPVQGGSGGGGEDDPISLTQTSPINAATEITIDAILKWEGNADEYDIYLDTNYPPELKVNTNTVTENEFELSGLQYSTRYYWKVVAKTATDSLESDMRSFTTGKPDIITWEKHYLDDFGEPIDMIEISDGGFIMIARELFEEPHLIKLDMYGNVIWDKYYPDLEDTFGVNDYILLKDPDGGFFILHQLDAYSYALEKFSSAGFIIESLSIETTHGNINSMIPTKDGGYALAGAKAELSNYSDLWFAKIDNTGTIIWEKTLGETYYSEAAYAIMETQDGGFAITGKSEAPNTNTNFLKYNIWLIKTDRNGNTIWDKFYGGTEDDDGRILVEKTNGDIVLGCNTKSKGAGDTDIWIIVIDQEGNTERATFGGTESDRIGDIVLTETGNIVISSESRSETAGYSDAWLFELDNSLDKLWEVKYGGESSDPVKALVGTQDGGYAMAVLSYSNPEQPIWVIKTDEEGIVREN